MTTKKEIKSAVWRAISAWAAITFVSIAAMVTYGWLAGVMFLIIASILESIRLELVKADLKS